MAGTITNIINTIFRTEGADRTERATDRVGRAQTRLGQSSASSGRQFAAQASGLGGLVAAYAGAAATTFALSAAFDALARSARAAQTLEGLNSIAAASAESGERILQSVREITNAQLTITEAAQQVNLSLSAGFDSSQIEGLAEVALKASRALGRDLTDAFTRVVRGSAKLETELLDELGIYTKIDPATRSYAAAIGKAASELTEYERRQAFVNSVIEEGRRKFSAINTTVPTTAEKIEAFGTKIIDLTTKVGTFIAEALAPLLTFLTENVGASIGTLALAGALALGKTLEVLRGSLDTFQNRIEERAARASGFFQKLNKEAVAAGQTAVRGVSLAPAGLAGGLQAELKALRDLSQQRALSTAELRKANSILQQRSINLEANRVSLIQQRAAELAVRNSITATTAEKAKANQEIKKLNASLRRTAVLSINTTAQMNALTAATTKTAGALGFLAATATTGILKLGAAIATAALGFLSFAGILVSGVAIFGLVGSAIAKAAGKTDEFNAFLKGTGEFFKGILSSAEKTEKKSVFLGSTANALEELEAVDSGLREIDKFEFKKKKAIFGQIEFNVEKTKQDLVNEVSSILAEVSRDTEKTLTESFASASTGIYAAIGAVIGSFFGPGFGTFIGGAIGAGVGTLVEYFSSDEIEISPETRSRLTAQFSDSLSAATPDVQEKLLQALASVEEKYAGAAAADPIAAAALKLQQQLIANSGEIIKNVDAIANVVTATGQSAQLISKNFDFAPVGEGLLSAYTDVITTIEGTTITFRTFDIDNTAVQEVINQEFKNILQKSLATIDVKPSVSSAVIDQEAIRRDVLKIQEQFKNVNISEAVIDDIKQLNLESLAPSLLALLSEDIKEFETAIDTILTLDARTSNLSIAKSFTAFSTALNTTTQEGVRATEVLRATADGVNNLSISYEQFQQSIGNAESALARADAGLLKSAKELNTLLEQRDSLISQGLDLTEQNALIKAEEDRFQALLNYISGSKEVLSILKDQEESFKRQADIQQFLKDINTKSKNLFTLQFEIATESGQSPIEALTSIFGDSNLKAAGDQYKAFVEKATADLQGIGASRETIQSILTTNTENLETQARLLSKEGLQLEVINNNYLKVTQTTKDVNGNLTDVVAKTTTISIQTRDIVENGILYNGVVEELQNRTSELLKQSLLFLANQEKITSELGKQLDIKNKEAEIEAAKLRLQRELLSIDDKIAANDKAIKTAEALIEAENTILDIEEAKFALAETQNDNAISALEAQLDFVKRIAEEELKRIDIQKQLADIAIKAADIQQRAGTADPSEKARIAIETQFKAAQAQNRLELEAIAARAQQVQQEASIRISIVEKEKAIADANLTLAQAELNNLEQTKEARLNIIKAESANTVANLEKQAAQARNEFSLAIRQRDLRLEQINQQRDADKIKANQNAQNLVNQLEIIKTDDQLKTKFLQNYAKLIEIDRGFIEGLDLDTTTATIDDLIGRINSAILDVNRGYDALAARQRDNAREEALIRQGSAARQLIIARQTANEERKAIQQRLKDTDLLIESEISAATAKVARAQQAAAITATALKDARTALEQAKSAGASEAFVQQVNFVLSQLENVQRFIDDLNSQTIQLTLESEAIARQIAEIQANEVILQARFEFDLSEIQRQAELLTQQQRIEALNLDKQLTEARIESKALSKTEGAKQLSAIENNILAERRTLLELESQQVAERFANQVELIDLQLQRDREKITQEASLAQVELEVKKQLVMAQIEGYKENIKALTDVNQKNVIALTATFNSFGDSFADILSAFANAIRGTLSSIEGFEIPQTSIDFKPISDTVVGAVNSIVDTFADGPGGSELIKGSFTKAVDALTRAFELNEEKIKELEKTRLTAADTAAAREAELLLKKADLEQQRIQYQLDNLTVEGAIAVEQQAARAAAAADAKKAADKILEALLSIFEGVRGAIETSLTGIKDYILFGEGNLRDVFVQLLRSIGDTIFEEGFAKPVSEFLTNSLFNLVGLPGKTGLEDAQKQVEKGATGVGERILGDSIFGVRGTTPANPLYVQDATQNILGSIAGGGSENVAAEAAGSIGGFFSNIGTTIRNVFTNLFGEGGFLSTLIGGFGNTVGNIFGGILKFITSIFGFASGGLVHRAGGGVIPQLASGGGLRDRVPALLEPGEFVLRRAAANKIGMANLQQMNATGQTGASAPVINIVNEGTAKTAESSEPRFDGEKYVIDIVTRDLQNNGPIRRSLRGGL